MLNSAEVEKLGRELVAALQYVNAWRGKTVVVKYGGSVLEENGVGTVLEDLVLLKQAGVHPVLVHGGGPEITRMLRALGRQTRFVNGLRVTDAETMEVVEMVLAGRVNKALVGILSTLGARAVGLSGKDGGLLRVRQLNEALGYVGEVEVADPSILHVLNREGYIPVVASIGLGPDGRSYNLNADTAAGALAVAMEASKFILLTDVEGIYGKGEDGPQLLSQLRAAEAKELIAAGVISEGMIPKVEACLRALEGGVQSAHIISGKIPHALLVELFTEAGIGTMLIP
ncbi:MAG: acetylglutamate kinase [Armatimonadota bacterium]|nr:acetylglutamate kinase [Armatimonadota bacterium]MDR5702994.1 acetylglutamate kinase [Armatimonadota bacterium]